MTETAGSPAKDWAENLRAYALAWGLPLIAILFGGKVIWWATEKAWGTYVDR